MNKKQLWQNLANYHFDNLASPDLWDEITSKFTGKNPFTKAFANKLCRKFYWNQNFALMAIWEYKKFVYLGVISDFKVTPSKIIDLVWHEHLLFSSAYRKFCNEVIQYEFDHHPELVFIESQNSAFQSQYMHTVELYQIEFGSIPPSEIWDNTKFENKAEKIKKDKSNDSGSLDCGPDHEPLISMYSASEQSQFGFEGGESGGGGAEGNWDDSSSDDSDSSSDSCSSCSSGCGGGD